MPGLNDVNINQPTGLDDPRRGDNDIRLTKAKTVEFAGIEHSLDGRHKFPIVSILPANDPNSRRLIIKTTIGQLDEIYYDTGTAWIKITRNNDIAEVVSDLLAHTTSNPIEHVDGSITTAKLNNDCVTKDKIGNGAVLGHHLNAADSVNPEYSVSSLVDGSDLDSSWHTHSQYDLGGSSGVNFLSSVLLAASGSGDIAWTTINANTLSGGAIPLIAKAVMLSINISLVNSGLGAAPTGVIIYGRKAIGSPSVTMNQYRVPTAVVSDSLSSIQAICPMTGTDGKFDFSVAVTADFIGTFDISIFGYYL